MPQGSGEPTPVAVDTVSDDGSRTEMDPILWLGGGVGLGSQGLSRIAEVGLQTGSHAFLARRASTAGFVSEVRDFAILYGRSRDGVAALAGVGLAKGAIKTSLPPPNNFSSTPGLALHMRWRLGTSGPPGLAMEGFANLNSEGSFGGFTLILEIGPF